MTKGVKKVVELGMLAESWEDAGQGWQGMRSELKLSGWDRKRKVVLLRRRVDEVEQGGQLFAGWEGETYEYGCLVTDADEGICGLAQLYRDRGDSENTFDEVKNQWGWGGYVTGDMKRCRYTAMAVGLAYNWWSVYARLANPNNRMEAISSRPMLMAGVGRMVKDAGRSVMKVTGMHAGRKKAEGMLRRVNGILSYIRTTAAQMKNISVYELICEYITSSWVAIKTRRKPLLKAPA